MSKRTLEGFFAPTSKKRLLSNPTPTDEEPKTAKASETTIDTSINPTSPSSGLPPSTHPTYPYPIPSLPSDLSIALSTPTSIPKPKPIATHPNLDLLYYAPLLPRPTATVLFTHLRSTLPFYRVTYTTKRSGTETSVVTPRYTTVFGIDATSRFNSNPESANLILDANSQTPIPPSKYACCPRPIPSSLAALVTHITAITTPGSALAPYNICLVNYYATGTDSIAFHSDDEAFLGPNPTIASLTLGDSQRDFILKPKSLKSPSPNPPASQSTQLKFPLSAGSLILMRGPTQSHWQHSVPKRTGAAAERGRMNITLRRALVPAGTENYYRYNVGAGAVYRWDGGRKEMVLWSGDEERGEGIKRMSRAL